jgi:hypothetical protein
MREYGTTNPVSTRRHWVGNVTGAFFSLIFAGESRGDSGFWNKKDVSAWTSDEVLQLMTRSPWAATARVLPKPGRDRGSTQAQVPEVGGGRSGGRGTGPEPVVQVAEVIVIWESGRPLVDTLKSRFPSDFANHYVLGVNDLPAGSPKRPVVVENMRASLQAKGKGTVDAGAVQKLQNVVLFGFSKELLPLTAADKDVVFSLETEQYSIRARFDPKEMIYKGMLAL